MSPGSAVRLATDCCGVWLTKALTFISVKGNGYTSKRNNSDLEKTISLLIVGATIYSGGGG